MNIIVTGASRGIGKAIAIEFAQNGHNIAIISRHKAEAEEVAEKLSKYNGVYQGYDCDVSDENAVKETFRAIYEKFKDINILVNNAGINSRKTLEISEDWFNSFLENLKGFREELAINLTGTYICTGIASHYMKPGSCIINISSIKAREPTSSPGYGASKVGVEKFTTDSAKQLAKKGIRVNCIAPGYIDTGLTAELSEEKKKKAAAEIPLQRFGEVEDIARMARVLASKDAAYMTGAIVDVNGGILMD